MGAVEGCAYGNEIYTTFIVDEKAMVQQAMKFLGNLINRLLLFLIYTCLLRILSI